MGGGGPGDGEAGECAQSGPSGSEEPTKLSQLTLGNSWVLLKTMTWNGG